MAKKRTGAFGATAGGTTPEPSRRVSTAGFTVIEMLTSVTVMVVVLAGAWFLLVVSGQNLDKILYGGQSSEANRAAFASFERDLGHAMLPETGGSAVMAASARSVSFMADVDSPPDGLPELVTWKANDSAHTLERVVKRAPNPDSALSIVDAAGFDGGATSVSTVMTGLASADDLAANPAEGTPSDMFSYAVSATDADWNDTPAMIGVVTFRLRNGLPDSTRNVMDRTNTFRVIAYVVNGY